MIPLVAVGLTLISFGTSLFAQAVSEENRETETARLAQTTQLEEDGLPASELEELKEELEPDGDLLSTERRPAPQAPAVTGHVTEDGAGVLGNIGFLGMQTFGREDSIAPAEILPYILLDEDFLFSNVRGFVSTEGRFGGNFGVGYRRLVPNQHAWYGVNAWYDVDDTSNELFHQLGLGLEAAFQSFELRSNAYFPIGNTDQTLSRSATNARFLGSQLVFDQQILRGYALRGIDVEVGYKLPLPAVGNNSELRWFVGGYFFGGNSGAGSIKGFQTRAEAQIATAVTTHLQFSKDEEYGSNLMVGMAIDFPFGEAHPTATWRRNTPSPFRFVHRNYNIILDRRDESRMGVAAINPLTGSEYVVAHVDTSAAGGGSGTADNPWASITDAQTSGADLIFVRAGSVIDEAITLGDNVSLIGDTGSQWLQVAGDQAALLPTFNADGAIDTPRVTGINGDAITLGNQSAVAGFQIDHVTGRGIVADHVTGASIRNVSFNSIVGDALSFTETSGTFDVQNVTGTQISGSGLTIVGGDMTLNLAGMNLQNTVGDGIRLHEVEAGTINLTNVTFAQASGHALEMINVDAAVNVSNLKASETDDVAIAITGGDEGVYKFTDSVILEDVAGGVRAVNTSSDIMFGLLKVATNSGDPGLFMENSHGEVQITSLHVESEAGAGAIFRNVDDLTINSGVIDSTGGAAFDAVDTVMSVTLDSVSADDADFGIRLDEMTGTFAVVGSNENGGMIQNSDVGVLLNNAGNVYLRNVDFSDNGTAIQSTGSELLAMSGLMISGSTGYAIDSLNDKLLSVQSSDFDENGTVDGGTIRVRADANGSYRNEFIGLRISDLKGTPIFISNSGAAVGNTLDTTFQGNVIEATRNNHSGIRVNWNGSTTVNATSNTIVTTGNSSNGFLIETPATTDRLLGTFLANSITVAGTNSNGISVVSSQESDLQVQANSITMAGSGGTGLKFDLSKVADVWIVSNTITDTGSAGTGIHFAKTADQSRIQLDANTIDMQSSSATVDRGIRFTTIADDATIRLFGAYNNTVTGATETIYVPANRTTGGFIINGAVVPQ